MFSQLNMFLTNLNPIIYSLTLYHFPVSALNMAVFSEGGVTFPDNILFLYFITILCLATTLNSLVLYHNYKKRPSLPRTLFIILASTDMMVVLIYSVGSAYSIWIPKMSSDIIQCSTYEVCLFLIDVLGT